MERIPNTIQSLSILALCSISCSTFEWQDRAARECHTIFDRLVGSHDFESIGDIRSDPAKRERTATFMKGVYEYYGPCDNSKLIRVVTDLGTTVHIETERPCKSGVLREKTTWSYPDPNKRPLLDYYGIIGYHPDLQQYLQQKSGQTGAEPE